MEISSGDHAVKHLSRLLKVEIDPDVNGEREAVYKNNKYT